MMHYYGKRFAAFGAAAAVAASMMLGGAHCKGEQQDQASMLVVFASGQVTLIRSGAGSALKPGIVVHAKDTIETKEGSVDLQTRAGTAIRLRSNSRVTVEEIAGDKQAAENRVALDRGSVFARAQKQTRAEEFNIQTPTAIAGVRGTSFSVTVNSEGKRPTVRVLSGKVAFAPKPKGATKSTKLPEVVLEERTASTLPKELEDQVLAGKSDLSNAELKTEPIRPTAEERLDDATLMTVTPNQFDDVRKGSTTPLTKLEQERVSRQDQLLKEMRRESAVRSLDNRQELRQYYSKVVTIRTKDGQTHTGAIISRSSQRLVVHTDKSGIVTLNSSQVESVQ